MVVEDSAILLTNLKEKVIVDALKNKAILEYEWILEQLFKGHKEDYNDLLTLITFIESDLKPCNFQELKEFFITNLMHKPCHNPLACEKDLVEIKKIK